jgi:tRNA pseudouridine55 synthase
MKKTEGFHFTDGEILLFDKPLYWTSFDLVHKVRHLVKKYTGEKKIKVGHAGTLDPMATGLMVICTGKATKKINDLTLIDKSYIATLRLGQTTPSFDRESEVDAVFPTEHITEELILSVLEQFKGESQQIPPLFSAKSINGVRAYELAREGRTDIELKSVTVTISDIQLISFADNELVISVTCTKGTYIRSLARDIGKALNSGAYLVGLHRTMAGEFKINNAYSYKEFQEILASLQPILEDTVL